MRSSFQESVTFFHPRRPLFSGPQQSTVYLPSRSLRTSLFHFVNLGPDKARKVNKKHAFSDENPLRSS